MSRYRSMLVLILPALVIFLLASCGVQATPATEPPAPTNTPAPQPTSEPLKPAQALIPEDFVFGDPLPDAPELAARGGYGVGVRTLEVVNPDQVDILKYDKDKNTDPRYDRPLTLEVWYPAIIPADAEEFVLYEENLGNSNSETTPNVPFQFPGRALRDADPDGSSGPYPLVIVSHGYPGSRLMMTYLTENLASKGYVVVAIDHTESTFSNQLGFASTLLNRSLDQLFVLDRMAQLGADSSSFLNGLVDADNTAIIGYSMGAYGALNSAGAGYNPDGAIYSWVPGNNLAVRSEGNADYLASLDPRVKAVVAFAPWGQGIFYGSPLQTWTATAMADIKIPVLFVDGSLDDVATYDVQGWGVKRLFTDAIGSDRYLLVYQNALHNIAPNPPPAASWSQFPYYERYSEAAWGTPRMNNINQHFVTAFLGMHLKGATDSQLRAAFATYLDLVPYSNDGIWGTDYWKGFKNRTALGLEMHHSAAA